MMKKTKTERQEAARRVVATKIASAYEWIGIRLVAIGLGILAAGEDTFGEGGEVRAAGKAILAISAWTKFREAMIAKEAEMHHGEAEGHTSAPQMRDLH